MPALTAEPEAFTPTSPSDVDSLLSEMFDWKREIIQRESEVDQEVKPLQDQIDELEAEIDKIRSKHEDYLKRRENAIETAEEAILEYAEEHQDDLLDGQEGKTRSTPFGSVSYRQIAFTFTWIDKELAIEALKKLGHSDKVRVQEKVYKGDLKKHPELCRKIDGVEVIEAHDEPSVELTIG